MFRHRSALIRDVRFPLRRDLALAWNAVRQGRDDLSTVLCLGAVAIYFLLRRLGNRPALAHRRAAWWFDGHPVRIVAQEAPRQR